MRICNILMNTRTALNTILAIAIILTLPSCGPKEYELDGSTKEKKGMSVRTETSFKLDDGNLTITALLGSAAGSMDMTNQSVEVSTVLDASKGKASKVKVFHEIEKSTFRTTVNGQTERGEENGPLHGTTVIQTYRDGAWHKELESGTPTKEQKRLLSDTKTAGMPSLYPDRKITLGETWTVPPEDFKRLLGSDVLTCDGSMTCTFIRVEDYDGHKAAVISAQLDGRATGLDAQNNEVEMKLNLQGTIYRSLDKHVDLRTELKGIMKWKADMVQEGQKITMMVAGPVTITGTSTLIK